VCRLSAVICSLCVTVCFLDMARKIHVEGYDELQNALQANEAKIIFILFCGSLEQNGQSWCPDCVKGIIYECSSFCDTQLFGY